MRHAVEEEVHFFRNSMIGAFEREDSGMLQKKSSLRCGNFAPDFVTGLNSNYIFCILMHLAQ